MGTAAVTIVYNEKINLPIWIQYYGSLFGRENLYVLDHGSNDGSTESLGAVNVIKIPRHKFDENEKISLTESFHNGLAAVFDAVIMTDCDEFVVADPARYRDLNDYINRANARYFNALGIDVLHVLTEQAPLDLSKPILSQRLVGRFSAPECKQVFSRDPIRWLPGMHASNLPPKFDTDLFLFHLKTMDYGLAMQRHAINLQNEWSENSLKYGYGAHHRWSIEQFVMRNFMTTIDLVRRDVFGEFEFSAEIAKLTAETVVDAHGFHRLPMNVQKMVRIPERFANVI